MHHELRMEMLNSIDRIFTELSMIRAIGDKTLSNYEIKETCETIMQKCIELERIFGNLYLAERNK
jgi:hypothetical protein